MLKNSLSTINDICDFCDYFVEGEKLHVVTNKGTASICDLEDIDLLAVRGNEVYLTIRGKGKFSKTIILSDKGVK